MIASLQSAGELKTTLCNRVRELPMTLEQIKQEALRDEYINRIKAKIFEKDHRTTDVLIPSTLQKCILKDFHAGHSGSTRMKSLIRSYVYWPNMDKDIENAVKLCKGCAQVAESPPLKSNPWPKMDVP